EDGIRDRTVTGVQTCALPIYLARGGLPRVVGRHDSRFKRIERPEPEIALGERRRPVVEPIEGDSGGGIVGIMAIDAVLAENGPRSEERRVGKESRARGGTY